MIQLIVMRRIGFVHGLGWVHEGSGMLRDRARAASAAAIRWVCYQPVDLDRCRVDPASRGGEDISSWAKH
jgi:hypothetical protein